MTAAQPLVLALVVCDGVWRDPSSGKHSLMGVFSGLGAATFPAQHPGMGVYVALTECYGTIDLKIVVVDDAGTNTLTEAKVEVRFADPLQVVELSIQIQTIVFPVPGVYRIQLIADTSILLERRLTVRQV